MPPRWSRFFPRLMEFHRENRGVRGGGTFMISTGEKERVNPGGPAAHADSFGPRGSLPSPRALPLPAQAPWPPARRPGRVAPATPSTFPTPGPARQQPKLLDRLRDALRSRHYSSRTEQTYCHWVKRFIFFHHSGTRRMATGGSNSRMLSLGSTRRRHGSGCLVIKTSRPRWSIRMF